MVAARMDSPPAVPKRCHLVGSYIQTALDHLLSNKRPPRFRPGQWRGLLNEALWNSRCVWREPITLFSLRDAQEESLFAQKNYSVIFDAVRRLWKFPNRSRNSRLLGVLQVRNSCLNGCSGVCSEWAVGALRQAFFPLTLLPCEAFYLYGEHRPTNTIKETNLPAKKPAGGGSEASRRASSSPGRHFIEVKT